MDYLAAAGVGAGDDMDKRNEIVTLATAVFGSQQAAVEWLRKPAVGLNWRRPINLLQTPEGAELVETFLRRLEFNRYPPRGRAARDHA